jgi:hypothetical protein
MTSPQSHLNARTIQEQRLAALQIAAQIGLAAVLAAAAIAGFAMLTTTLAAMPDVIAESVARRAW